MSYTYHSETYGRPALESSAEQEWPGLHVERFELEAMALPAHFHAQHLLDYTLRLRDAGRKPHAGP